MNSRRIFDSQSQLRRETEKEIFGTTNYVWPIENIIKRYKSAEPITARFYSDHSKHNGWYISLYPKGSQGNSNEAELSIEFISSENKQFIVEGSIVFRRPPTSYLPHPILSFSQTFLNGQVHVVRPFFRRTIVVNSRNHSPSGSCMITFAIRTKLHTELPPPSRNTDSDIPANCLIHDLSFLHDNPKLTDVTVNVGDVHYPVHRIILAARSPVFSAMFEDPGTLGNQDNQINIKDFTPEVVKELLRYIYTDQVDISEGTVRDLLVAANKYGLENLKLKCSHFIVRSINNDNAAEVLLLADRENAMTLRADAVAYIDDNLEEIIETPGYTDLTKNHPYLLVELVRAAAKRPRRM